MPKRWCPRCLYDLRGTPEQAHPNKNVPEGTPCSTTTLACSECGWTGRTRKALTPERIDNGRNDASILLIVSVLLAPAAMLLYVGGWTAASGPTFARYAPTVLAMLLFAGAAAWTWGVRRSIGIRRSYRSAVAVLCWLTWWIAELWIGGPCCAGFLLTMVGWGLVFADAVGAARRVRKWPKVDRAAPPPNETV
ncbi:MAG: hypothetical protein AAF288_07385 [Planctomycetota bacterium]